MVLLKLAKKLFIFGHKKLLMNHDGAYKASKPIWLVDTKSEIKS